MLGMMSNTEVMIVIVIAIVFFVLVVAGVWLVLRRLRP
jgi:hypothetical protein